MLLSSGINAQRLFLHPEQMRHVAAYLLLQIGGNASPSAADIKKLLSTVGIEADDARLDTLISELRGKSINDVSVVYQISVSVNERIF